METGVPDEDVCDKQDIALTELKRIKKRPDFENFVKAYQHNLKSGYRLKFQLTLMPCYYLLSGITPNKRPKSGFLELLDLVLDGRNGRFIDG